MADQNAGTWRSFLQARVAQEEGKDEEALAAFDQLLRDDPDNVHLQRSRTAALLRLDRQDEAAVARIAERYGELARKYSGSDDKPDLWISGLNELLREIDEKPRPVAAVFW